jgi:hypothetical protein
MRVPSFRVARSLSAIPLGLAVMWLSGCSSPSKPVANHYGNNVQITPSNPLRRGATEDICEIFRDNPNWFVDAHHSYRRWGTPIAVQLAFVYQESRFVANASPKTSFTVFSNKSTSALGYAQALNGTWDDYVRSTGNYQGHRSNMHDALDFIGWYNNNANRKLGLTGDQVRELYLAYHEGLKGYSLATYDDKAWLKSIADQVESRAIKYDKQLRGCSNEIVAMVNR